MRNLSRIPPFTFGLALTLFGAGLNAQPCSKPKAGEWRKVALVDQTSNLRLNLPVHMSILPDDRVLINEMFTGKIKLFTPGLGVTEAASIDIYNDNVENGLLGIAADPEFSKTNWVYVFFSRRLPGNSTNAGDPNVFPHEHVLVRYTFSGGKLGNMKELLSFKRQSKRHAAGGIAFHPGTGDLYIPTGDDVFPSTQVTHWGGRNETESYLNDLGTAANTNDLRGKVLRIRPLPFPDNQTPAPGVGSTYSIPEGNLFPPGMPKTRPEIYSMGHRNPYRLKIDPVSGFVLVSDVGPDAGGPDPQRGPTGSDEFNLVTQAGNFGWPFAIADNQPYVAYEEEPYAKGTVFDVKNLKNLSKFNTGMENLPPATGALAYYNARNSQTGPNTAFGTGSEAAIAGPYYRYQEGLPATRLPAYFHGKFIVSDFRRGKIWSLEMNSDKSLKKVETEFDAERVIDMNVNSKGELYVLLLGEGTGTRGGPNTGVLYKMEYTGTHYPASACAQSVFAATSVGITDASNSGQSFRHGRLIAPGSINRRLSAPSGARKAVVTGIRGELLWEGTIRDGLIELPALPGNHLGYLRFE